MRRSSVFLAEVFHGLAFLVMVLSGLYFLSVRFGWLPADVEGFLQGPGKETLTVWAGLSFLLALYFLTRGVLAARGADPRVMSAGPRGPIWISQGAIRDFILQSLREELGFAHAAVSLRQGRDGIVVQVRTPLPLHQSVTELGAKIQEHVKTRVEERIGVTVERVEVLAKSVQSASTPTPTPTPTSTSSPAIPVRPPQSRAEAVAADEGEGAEPEREPESESTREAETESERDRS